MQVQPDKAVGQVKAMCVLHNYLMTTEDQRYVPAGLCDAVEADGQIREGFWRESQVATDIFTFELYFYIIPVHIKSYVQEKISSANTKDAMKKVFNSDQLPAVSRSGT